MPRVMAMLTKAELERLPREIRKALEAVRSEKPGLPDEALLGEALSRDSRLIRTFREWEREGRPSPAEKEFKTRLGVLDRLRSDAIILGAQIDELRRRVQVLYPKPAPPPQDPREVPRRPQERETWTLPVRKSDEDWRVSILENSIAELGALVDVLSPAQRDVLNHALNLLGQLAEELGGERSRRRLRALAAV